MNLAPGTRLGPYEIVAPLGAGGMGEVYRARDPRLDREVAVKVLPAAFAADAERMRRFTQEARAAGSLQHPNIVTVFDVGTESGVSYVVQELVPGGSLRDRLGRGTPPVREVLRLASGIAAGLAAAHEKGIVHRDLKPENVALAAEGRPQVLDFGLARVARPLDEAALTAQPTSDGLVIGTVGYMAPEQVRGETADARSDLFALGTMLHEMLSGARPFSKGSAVETLHAILTDEPPPLPAHVPPALQRVVARCLEKDPRLRFQSARDLAFTLDLVAGEDPRAAAVAASAPHASRGGIPAWAQAAAALVLVAAGFAAGRLAVRPAGESTVRVTSLSQGTRDASPAVSPDGRLVAFSAVRPSGQGIWIMDMTSRNEERLTSGADDLPRFTPDGATVLFVRTENARQSLWRVPVIGGTPRMLLEEAADADASPDGARLAYMTGTSDSAGVRAQLRTAKADGTGNRDLLTVGSFTLAQPRWSPDGRSIALIRAGSQNVTNAVLVVDAANGSSRAFPAPNGSVLSNACWDGTGSGLIVAEGEGIVAIQSNASGRLYRLDIGSGRWKPLGWLGDFPLTLDLLPDGRLVTSPAVASQNLREADAGARSLADARRLTSGIAVDRQPIYTPDGRSVLFSSNRGGTLDLWEVSTESGEMHRLTDDPADDWDPVCSRDGTTLYWSSNRSGAFEVWAARRDGTSPRQVSRDSVDAENPGATPDGRWLVYSSANPAKSGLWRVPAEGGEGEQLVRTGSLIPDLSPDGRYVSVIMNVGTLTPSLGVFDIEERRWLPSPVPLRVVLRTVQLGRSRWTPDGGALVYLDATEGGRTLLVRRPLSAWRGGGGRIDTLFASSTEDFESFSFSPDGRRITLSMVDWRSSLTIAEGVPGIVGRKAAR